MCLCISGPGGHHGLQSSGSHGWFVWVARFAAGLRGPPHHRPHRDASGSVCVPHGCRQSWVSLGPVVAVRPRPLPPGGSSSVTFPLKESRNLPLLSLFVCRCILLIVLFGQFLKETSLPVPAYSREAGLTYSRVQIFKMLPVNGNANV